MDLWSRIQTYELISGCKKGLDVYAVVLKEQGKALVLAQEGFLGLAIFNNRICIAYTRPWLAPQLMGSMGECSLEEEMVRKDIWKSTNWTWRASQEAQGEKQCVPIVKCEKKKGS